MPNPPWLAAITARCAAATKGPWESPLRDLGRVDSFRAVDFYFDESYEAYPPLGEAGPVFVTPTLENAAFLTAARADVPDLCALVEALAGALEEAQAILASEELAGMQTVAQVHGMRYPEAFSERCRDARMARAEALARYRQGPEKENPTR